MNCNNCNNRLCSHYIISDSVTVVTVSGVDTLVIDIPLAAYGNGQKYCIVVRTLPAGVTVNMPVAISIGGDTSTVYPLVCGRTGLQAIGCQVNGRSRIQVCVQTNATTGIFKAFSGLNFFCPDVLASLPIAPVAATTATAFFAMDNGTVKETKTVTTTTKREVKNNE